MKSKKQFLYNDIEQYNYNLEQEKIIFDLFNEIKEQAVSTLGEYEINYVDLFKDPSYLINTYWSEFANRPKHIEKNKESICVTDTNLNIPLLKKNVIAFNRALLSRGDNIQLNKKGLKSLLSKDKFDRYLDPDKADHYKAIKKLYDASIEIQKFSPQSAQIHILRYCQGFIMESGNLEIHYLMFAE